LLIQKEICECVRVADCKEIIYYIFFIHFSSRHILFFFPSYGTYPYNSSYIKWQCFYVAPTMTLWCFNRQVSIEEGDAKSRESGIMFIETSAKAGFNIKVKFDQFSESPHNFMYHAFEFWSLSSKHISIWETLNDSQLHFH